MCELQQFYASCTSATISAPFCMVAYKKKKKKKRTHGCWSWRADFFGNAGFSPDSGFEEAQQLSVRIELQRKSSLCQATNAEASCDLVANLFTVSAKTCQGERSRFSIVALLDVAQIACTINVHKVSVMRSLWTPEGWSAADCVVRKGGVACCYSNAPFESY